MKQFNLEEYLKNPEIQVTTRDGYNVRIICTNRRDVNYMSQYPIVALIQRDNNSESFPFLFSVKGEATIGRESTNDLFFKTEPCKEQWINIYQNNQGEYYSGIVIYKSMNEALINRGATGIATVKINIK